MPLTDVIGNNGLDLVVWPNGNRVVLQLGQIQNLAVIGSDAKD